MTRLTWGSSGNRQVHSGVSRGVFYDTNPNTIGVAWPGLKSIQEGEVGGELESYYHDGNKYMDVVTNADYQAVLETFDAPKEFNFYSGRAQLAPGLFATGQGRLPFNFTWRTEISTDTDQSYFLLHFLWNVMASSSQKTYATRAESVDPAVSQWTLNSVPAYVNPASAVLKPTAHLVVDTRYAPSAKVTALENYIYGSPSSSPLFPTQAQLVTMMS